MNDLSREAVAKSLAGLGLKRTLIAMREANVFSVNIIKAINEGIQFDCVGSFIDSNVPFIGRVGLADPKLAIPWTQSMTFYGKWFDQLAKTDSSYTLRRNIISLPQENLLAQIYRDDEYGLIASYYSIFQKILDVKRRVPLVLFDDSLLTSGSFPVILPDMKDKALQQDLERVLRLFIKKETSTDKTKEDDGIEVEELSTEEFSKYFAAKER